MYFIVEMYAFHKFLDKTRQRKCGLRIWKKVIGVRTNVS